MKRRIAAFLIDGIIVAAPLSALFVILGVVDPGTADAATITEFDNPTSDEYSGLSAFTGVFFFFWPWLYFSWFESSRKQATLGKRWMGLIVANAQGQRIGFGRATGRYFSKYISASILFFGFFIAFWSKSREGLHDIFARTVVLQAGHAPESLDGVKNVLS